MPYADKVCTACDAVGNYYHNVHACRKCGEVALVSRMQFDATSPAGLRQENTILRAEVNALRKRLKLKPKYFEYGTKPTTNRKSHENRTAN